MQKTWKKLLFLVCGICITTGAFAGGDEGDGLITDPSAICDVFEPNDSIYDDTSYNSWSTTCSKGGDVCRDWYEMFPNNEAGNNYGEVVTTTGSRDFVEVYKMYWVGDGQQAVSNCYIDVEYTFYRCADGYYGKAAQANTNTCKKIPQNASVTWSEDGKQRTGWTCNSGYTKLTVNGTASCCATSWTNGTRTVGGAGYKYRACWPEGSTTSVGLYTCQDSSGYYATNFNPASVTCTWSTSTNKPSGTCSGCTKCTTGTSYGDGTGTGVQIVYNTTKSTSTHSLYGTYVTACTKSVSSYRCKGGYYGSPTGSAGTCNACPTTTSTGLTTVRGTSDNDAWTTGTSAAGATSKTQCYANSGYTDLGDEMITIYNDGTGNFYWGSNDDNQYDCYYTN